MALAPSAILHGLSAALALRTDRFASLKLARNTVSDTVKVGIRFLRLKGLR